MAEKDKEMDDKQTSGSETPAVRVRKRKRQTLSCEECRRRKIRCDQVIPCGPCTRRSEANLCHKDLASHNSSNVLAPQALLAIADSGSKDVVPASASVVENLAERVIGLETLFPRLAYLEKLASQSSHLSRSTQSSASIPKPAQTYDDSEAIDSETEAAVLTLEGLAMGTSGLPQSRAYGPIGARSSLRNPRSIPSATASSTSGVVSSSYFDKYCSILLDESSSQSYLSSALNTLLGDPRAILMNSIRKIMPSMPTVDGIIAAYRSEVSWLYPVLHRPTFEKQLSEFFSIESAHPQYCVDPAWLAVFCIVMSLGSMRLNRAERLQFGWSDEDHSTAVAQWFSASRLCLLLADWSGKPQVRTLQTVVLYGALISHAVKRPTVWKIEDLGGSDGAHLATWLSAAVQIARKLNIDKLESPETMPNDDPAWPSGNNSFKREIARRIWMSLVSLDRGTSAFHDREPVIPLNSYTTAIPLRCQDEDLGSDLYPSERTPLSFCDADPLIYQFEVTHHMSRISKLMLSKKKISYDDIMDLDVHLRPLFPRMLGSDVEYLPPSGNLRRDMLQGALHNRLLRLHRPFFVRGLKNVRYGLSTQTCLTCARAIIALYCRLDIRSPSAAMWSLHCLGASVVLHLKRLCAIDGMPQAPSEGLSDEALQNDARNLFHLLETNEYIDERVQKLARQAGVMVDELQKVSSARPYEEPVTQILQQVVNHVNSNHTLSSNLNGSEAYPVSAWTTSAARPGDALTWSSDPGDLLRSIGLDSEQTAYESMNMAVDWALFGFDAPIDGQG